MKVLIQTHVIVDVRDEDEAFELQQKVDAGSREGVIATLAEHGADLSDLDGVFEYLGTSLMVIREEIGI